MGRIKIKKVRGSWRRSAPSFTFTRGLWMRSEAPFIFICSLCRERVWHSEKFNYCPNCGKEMDLTVGPLPGEYVYKLYDCIGVHDCTSDGCDVYIATNISDSAVIASLYAGFAFYLETKTAYGIDKDFPADYFVAILCDCIGAVLFDERNLPLLGDVYDPRTKDLKKKYWVDFYNERERRCGPDYEQWIAYVEPYTKTPFFKKLCAYYNSDEILDYWIGCFLPAEEIWKRY